MVRYKPVRLDAPDRSISYGLLAEEKSNGRWVAVAITPDVSTDEKCVSRLAKKYTRQQIEPGQLLEQLAELLPVPNDQ